MNQIVSYIIRTKNEAYALQDVCDRIRRQEGDLQHEIIIVDSGSTDGTLAIAECAADQVLCIPPEKFTWGYALNFGIQHASGDTVCLISGHCRLEHAHTIADSYEILSAQDYACIYGKQVGDVCLDKIERILLEQQYPVSPVPRTPENGLLPGVSNACCLLKKSVWEVLPFDEEVPSAEDGLWFEEIQKVGYTPAYCSKLCVIHGHKFDAEYIYRKCYWRAFQSEEIAARDYPFIWVRFWLSFFIRNMRYTSFYYWRAQKYALGLSFWDCFQYSLLEEMAILRGRLDHRRSSGGTHKYNVLTFPRIFFWVKNRMKDAHFYESQSG